MMHSKMRWVVLSLVFSLSLVVVSVGCIHESPVHPEIHIEGGGGRGIGWQDSNPEESQSEVLSHMETITESLNRAIASFNDREYDGCLTECEQLKRENREYAASIESFEHCVTNASLSRSGEAYYGAQLSILRAIHHSINESASDLYQASEYSSQDNDSHARYHSRRAAAYVDATYSNIVRFNENVGVSNSESARFASPAPDPPDPEEAPSLKADLSDIPDPYYRPKSRFQNTPDEVKRLLGKGFITPYQCSVFDCSEMAAYIEWKLECHNVTAYIATMDDWQDGYGHAWVIVPLRGGKYLAVEPTVSATEGSLGAEMITYEPEYFVYDQLFEDIYGASEFFGVGEWDWWNKLDLR
ncbi:MAG: hypothetical protein U9Q68_04520 [Euryarchaeota archaeon]|nr:hypothetical protein [Euryarchaeota archaeon]